MQKIVQKVKHFFKNIKWDKNTILVSIAVVGVVIAGGLIYANSNPNFSLANIFGQSNGAIAQKAVKYINDNGLSQTPATLDGNVSEESGLVKFKIKIGTNSFDTYATKDGKLFFPQVFVMEKAKAAAATAKTDTTAKTANVKPADVAKVDKPMYEAYVVARCPFGLQIQRAMASAVQSQPQLAQYIKVRYMGNVNSDGKTISSMHGAAEGVENLRQICIREEQPAKYWPYVACQMKASGQEVACEKSTGVDSGKLASCVSDTNKGIAYAKADFALDTKYNVTGSPTSILNGAPVSEFDFGGRSADAIRSMVCASFKNQPSFCSTKLQTGDAATSFSATYATANTGSSGNSGANGANCAPAQ